MTFEFSHNHITECINGDRHRDCNPCPAYSANGGECCFGVRHEYGDPDCSACAIKEDCSRITHHIGVNDPRLPRRVVYSNTRSIAPTPLPTRVPITPYAAAPPPVLASTVVQSEPIQIDPSHGVLQHFVLIGLWGAVEGFFTLALDYLKRKRPQ